MRYTTFEAGTPAGPLRRIGLVTPSGHLLDLNQAYAHVLADRVDPSRARTLADAVVPADLIALLANGPVGQESVAEALAALGPSADNPEAMSVLGGSLVYRVEMIRLLAPLPRPASLRDCSAFEQHVRTASRGQVPPEWYEMPVYYKGNPASVIGTGTVGGGCGLELRRYPQPGDLVELEVDGLGVLRNRWIGG